MLHIHCHSSFFRAVSCAFIFLSFVWIIGCSLDHAPTDEAPLPSQYYNAQDTPDTTEVLSPLVETGATVSLSEETVDISDTIKEASISILSRNGMLGDYDFFTCNETQLFGDFSISLAEYSHEEYLMLSYGGIVLLAKEDGSDAKLFYNNRRLDLPFSCYFNMDYELLSLHIGDFLGNGGYQLALVIPTDNGSGVDVDQLQIIDLNTMSLVPIYTHKDTYEADIRYLFDRHFTKKHPGIPYELFQYVQYDVVDGLIFVEYGACDEDNNYLCFLETSLIYDGTTIILDDELSFQDHMHANNE